MRVNNLEEARKYYENILGLKLKFNFSKNGMIAFNIGNEEPAIILKDESVFPNMKPTIWFEVENEYRKLKENGVKFLFKPCEIMTGMAVEFDDPFLEID